MNLAEYRLKAVVRQRNRLRLCLAAAGMLHGGAIALIQPWTKHSTSIDPIQFIAIDQSDFSPISSNKLATTRSLTSPIQPIPQVISTLTGTTRSPASLAVLPDQPKTLPPASLPSVAAVKDEVWDMYLATLKEKIYQRWQAALSVKTDRPAQVRFIIDRQGHLIHLELVQSSSDVSADQAAVKAVQTAAPFAQLPLASAEDRLRVTFTFEASGVP
ncbi:MAG: TonB C-terminal domain-containing protein [Timaviella obliquedivisa GSE-PSE-MK23-08B]|jgi:TonB family protein|nr:TonB C-terminal domain-containing protein [Timaviella obliquedivisa GSE-PSE-MK23-08B]